MKLNLNIESQALSNNLKINKFLQLVSEVTSSIGVNTTLKYFYQYFI